MNFSNADPTTFIENFRFSKLFQTATNKKFFASQLKMQQKTAHSQKNDGHKSKKIIINKDKAPPDGQTKFFDSPNAKCFAQQLEDSNRRKNHRKKQHEERTGKNNRKKQVKKITAALLSSPQAVPRNRIRIRGRIGKHME